MTEFNDDLLYEFQTLRSVDNQLEDNDYITGTFGYNGCKAVVHSERGGFSIYSSTDRCPEEVMKLFESRYSIPEIYVTDGDVRDFEKVFPNHYNDDWDVEAVKGLANDFGFCASERSRPEFKGSTCFWIFSDDSFDYTAESVRPVYEEFAELIEAGEEERVLLEQITSFALDSHSSL